MANESKYTTKLRELGFMQQDELWTPEETREADAKFQKAIGRSTRMPRSKRREYLAKKLIPGFVFLRENDQDKTCALDELGVTWIANGWIDLTHLGFHNGEKTYSGFAVPLERKLH